MSKVLPIAIHDRPELNLRQGIKSSLNHWRQLIATLYLLYRHINDGGNEVYAKEVKSSDRTGLVISDDFAIWLDTKWNSIPNIKELAKQCPLFQAQMEHLQVGIELFLKLAKVEFVNTNLADAVERTGGSRFAKKLYFSTNMKILAETVAVHPTNAIVQFITKWLSGQDDITIGNQLKGILLPFTEECQYKIRTSTGEIFFQQDGLYTRLRNHGDTVESSDIHEPVGPFRILKSYVKEGMHPYLADGANGFSLITSASDFVAYADMVRTTLELIPKRTTIYQETQAQPKTSSSNASDKPRQRITYGAPGTGKSHKIEDVVGMNADTVRTTFHPDSDYSTFVGCYKPTMEKKPRYGQQGLPIKVNGVELTEDVISYSYVPQAFTKAYVRAWSKLFDSGKNDEEKRQYLVIEEINRGNCAQIFGDLFQLLDRKGDWYSKYPIEADTDLARYIGEELGRLPQEMKANIPAEVLSGAKLILPPNLYIWATMNTSDQSLFPMDSAFKRRWEWEYIPIKNAGEEDSSLVWKIVADGEEFPWWDFLKTINKCILDALKNEDKQLGYFFARPDDDTSDVIPASKFVNKVLFYLYNDVFKDYELPKGFAKPGGGKFAFADFFLTDGKPDETKVKELLSNLLPKEQQPGAANT